MKQDVKDPIEDDDFFEMADSIKGDQAAFNMEEENEI